MSGLLMPDMTGKTRGPLRQQVIEMGVPADEADVLVDLALHAAQSGIWTCERIATSVHNVGGIAAFGLALGLMRTMTQACEDILKAAAAEAGLSVTSGEVQVRL